MAFCIVLVDDTVPENLVEHRRMAEKLGMAIEQGILCVIAHLSRKRADYVDKITADRIIKLPGSPQGALYSGAALFV